MNAYAGDWASQEIFGHVEAFERFCSFSVLDEGEMIGAVILYNHDPDAGVIEISLAGRGKWLSRRLITRSSTPVLMLWAVRWLFLGPTKATLQRCG